MHFSDALHASAYLLISHFAYRKGLLSSLAVEIFKRRKVSLVVLRKEQWDSDGYLEGTTWYLYPRAAKLPRSLLMQVKLETNRYTEACNTPKSTYAAVYVGGLPVNFTSICLHFYKLPLICEFIYKLILYLNWV